MLLSTAYVVKTMRKAYNYSRVEKKYNPLTTFLQSRTGIRDIKEEIQLNQEIEQTLNSRKKWESTKRLGKERDTEKCRRFEFKRREDDFDWIATNLGMVKNTTNESTETEIDDIFAIFQKNFEPKKAWKRFYTIWEKHKYKKMKLEKKDNIATEIKLKGKPLYDSNTHVSFY